VAVSFAAAMSAAKPSRRAFALSISARRAGSRFAIQQRLLDALLSLYGCCMNLVDGFVMPGYVQHQSVEDFAGRADKFFFADVLNEEVLPVNLSQFNLHV
jgi:hypothetical protein